MTLTPLHSVMVWVPPNGGTQTWRSGGVSLSVSAG
jgi:hypothetical protein